MGEPLRCSSCDTPLVWAVAAGRTIAVELDPVAGGNIVLVTTGRANTRAEFVRPRRRHVCHREHRCPKAAA